jgi:hypothetical protein
MTMRIPAPVVALLVLTLTWTAAGSAVSTEPTPGLGPVQLAIATRIATEYADREDADVRFATGSSFSGTVDQANTGVECGPGPLLRITIAGAFPRIVTTGTPGSDSDGTVTAVLLTADPGTEQICQISVRTGQVGPDADRTLLLGAASHR